MAAIEIAGLKKYYGKARGIEDVTLSVEPGEIFGFIGPNGAGKSTTIRTLLGFLLPSGGTARVLGFDVVAESVKIRSRVGYLPSEVGYYDDMTVGGLLDYTAGFYGRSYRESHARIEELATLFELDRRRKIQALSLGNKRKVGIVVALLHRPALLILDEPTSALDPLMQQQLFEVLEAENKRGTTVFFSSHVLSEVERLCHRVGIIKDGRILKVEDLRSLRRSQFRKVRILFREGSHSSPQPQIAGLRLPGVVHEKRDGRAVELLYSGDPNALVRLLAERDLEGLWVEEPTLEEVFFHYYEKGGDLR